MKLDPDVIAEVVPAVVAKVAKEHYGFDRCVFVSELKTADGYWSNSPAYIFWAPNADAEKGHSMFPALFIRNGKLFITDASSMLGVEVHGVMDRDGSIYYSTHRHDCVFTPDGNMIDGGRSYSRTSTVDGSKLVSFTLSRQLLADSIRGKFLSVPKS